MGFLGGDRREDTQLIMEQWARSAMFLLWLLLSSDKGTK